MDQIITAVSDNTYLVASNNKQLIRKDNNNSRVAEALQLLGIVDHYNESHVYYTFYENSNTLSEYLDNNPSINSDTLASELIIIIGKLHANGIVHGDIHLENIIVTDDGPKLVDFEQSCFIDEINNACPLFVPRNWDGKNNVNTDLFGLAACLFRIYDNESPLPIGTSIDPNPDFYTPPNDITLNAPDHILTLIRSYLSYQF